MATDDDRRRVAERLREYASWDEEGCLTDCAEWGESVLDLLNCGDTDRETYAALADLIDPGESGQNLDRNRDTVQQESPAVQKAPECDREALLALAGQLDSLGLNGFSSGWSSGAVNVGSFARRIREACGEVDG